MINQLAGQGLSTIGTLARKLPKSPGVKGSVVETPIGIARIRDPAFQDLVVTFQCARQLMARCYELYL